LIGNNVPTTVIGNTCTISESRLRSTPFFLGEQASVSCQVIAVNQRCDSGATVGAGAIMPILSTVADQPTIQFVSRGCETLTVQCNPGNFNGGAEITAYQITYYEYFDTFNNNNAGFNNNAFNNNNAGFNTQNVLSNSVIISNTDNINNINTMNNINNNLNNFNNDWSRRQATITGLTDGREYAFQCSALNRIGYSVPSNLLQIQSGTVPFQPQNVRTDLMGDHTNVAITWENQYQCNTYWPVTGCTVAIQYDRLEV
jgi:hypothetical protein